MWTKFSYYLKSSGITCHSLSLKIKNNPTLSPFTSITTIAASVVFDKAFCVERSNVSNLDPGSISAAFVIRSLNTCRRSVATLLVGAFLVKCWLVLIGTAEQEHNISNIKYFFTLNPCIWSILAFLGLGHLQTNLHLESFLTYFVHAVHIPSSIRYAMHTKPQTGPA